MRKVTVLIGGVGRMVREYSVNGVRNFTATVFGDDLGTELMNNWMNEKSTKVIVNKLFMTYRW